MTTNITSFLTAETSREKTLAYLREHGTVSSMRAITEWGETRLAARIEELRNEGWEIITHRKRALNGRTYAEYEMSDRQRAIRHPRYLGPIPCVLRTRDFEHEMAVRGSAQDRFRSLAS